MDNKLEVNSQKVIFKSSSQPKKAKSRNFTSFHNSLISTIIKKRVSQPKHRVNIIFCAEEKAKKAKNDAAEYFMQTNRVLRVRDYFKVKKRCFVVTKQFNQYDFVFSFIFDINKSILEGSQYFLLVNAFCNSISTKLALKEVEIGVFEQTEFTQIFVRQVKTLLLTAILLSHLCENEVVNTNCSVRIKKLFGLHGIFLGLLLCLAVCLNNSLCSSINKQERRARKLLNRFNIRTMTNKKVLLEYLSQIQQKTVRDCLKLADLHTFKEKFHLTKFKNCLVQVENKSFKSLVEEVSFLREATKKEEKRVKCYLTRDKLISRVRKLKHSVTKDKSFSISIDNSVCENRTLMRSMNLKLDY